MATLTAALLQLEEHFEPLKEQSSFLLQGRRGQNRIIEMPIVSSTSSSSSSSTPSSGLLLGINGLLPDSVSLLQTARRDIEKSQHLYGIHRPPSLIGSNPVGMKGETVSSMTSIAASSFGSAPVTAMRVAEAMADVCQQRSFGGGIRPLGASVVVCGLDLEEISVCVTNPSGAVSYYNFDARRRQQERGGEEEETKDDLKSQVWGSGNVIVVGGDPRSREVHSDRIRRQLQRRIQNVEDSNKAEENVTHKDKYRILAKVALQAACEGLLNIHDESFLNRGGESKDCTDQPKNRLMDHIDLVLVTSQGGVQRLSKNQIQRVMESLR